MKDAVEEDSMELKQALGNIHNSKFQLQRKVNELKTIRVSLVDALARGQVTKEDFSFLKSELENLVTLRQVYEVSVDTFNDRFAWNHAKEADEVNKGIDDNLNACFNIKVNVDILLRKINSKLSVDSSSNEDEEVVDDKDPTACKLKQELEEPEIPGVLEEETKEKTTSVKLAIFLCLLIVIISYCSLALIIGHVENQKEAEWGKDTTLPTTVQEDLTTCGADSFMLRDGVCDDVANIAKCLFDGGDCCQENKDKALCRDCICILKVNHEDMKKQFQELEIKPVKNPSHIKSAIGNDGWAVEVEEVVSTQVCTVVCLEHNSAGELNAWLYLDEQRICKCGWVGSSLCPRKWIVENWTWKNKKDDINHPSTFVQLKKTVSCDCLASGFLITADISKKAQVDYGDTTLEAHSLWHCQQLCSLYDDCVWFSWKGGKGVRVDDREPAPECRLMSGQRENSTMPITITVDSEWLSSSEDCLTIGGYFIRYSSPNLDYNFVCPTRSTVSSSRIQQVKLSSKGTGEKLAQFLIFVDGWMQSSISVMKFEQDGGIIECSHSLLPPENGLVHATGGVLAITRANGEDEPVVVVCGGEFALGGSRSDIQNQMCLILNEHGPAAATVIGHQSQQSQLSAGGFLNNLRIGAASLVIDRGQTLWVTAGSTSDGPIANSEFVSAADNSTLNKQTQFMTNSVGPDLPREQLMHHCLEMLGPEIAMLIGGKHSEGGYASGSTWFLNVNTMTWEHELTLRTPRYKHACGVLKVGQEKMVVAAAGIDQFEHPKKNVEVIVVHEGTPSFVTASHWDYGPNLPMALSDAASATNPEKTELFVIGGTTSNAEMSDSVHSLSCSHFHDNLQHGCSWTKIEFELNKPSTMGLALIFPANPMHNPITKDCNKDVADDESILLLTTGLADDFAIGDTGIFIVPPLYASNQADLTECKPSQSQRQSMHALKIASGGVLNANSRQQSVNENFTSTSYLPVVCGGMMNVDEGKCFHIGPTSSLPAVVGIMQEKRMGAASASILNGEFLWVTGGTIAGATATTEFLSVSDVLSSLTEDNDKATPLLTKGIQLPRPMTYHCLEMVNGEMAILYGGTNALVGAPLISSTWILENFGWTMSSSGSEERLANWTIRAPMAQGRYQQSCGVISTDVTSNGNPMRFVVSAGGFLNPVGESVPTKSVELLRAYAGRRLITATWEEGPSLPHTLAGAASATREDQTELFVAGGLISQNPYVESTKIYRLKCSLGACWWKKDDMELKFGRVLSVAMAIPPVFGGNVAEYPLQCVSERIGDTQCDAVNNNAKCEFDGGDCCSRIDEECPSCYGEWCHCHETGFSLCRAKGIRDELCYYYGIGDNRCQGENNKRECEYDSGDCCWGLAWSFNFCEYQCECLKDEICQTQLIADGECNANNNNILCNYDGGDCCLGEATFCYCSNPHECKCHLTKERHCLLVPETCKHFLNADYIGDEVCDDELNNQLCGYDGGDCCLPHGNMDYCKGCECIP